MSALPWINYDERVVGKNHPSLTDVANRVLRQLLTQSGEDPDADGLEIGRIGEPINWVNVQRYAGATAGDQIIAAILAQDLENAYQHYPMVLDMRGYRGVQVIDKPIADNGIGQYAKNPMIWLWGGATWWISVLQKAMTNHVHVLDGATLVFGKKADGTRQTGCYGFFHSGLGCQLATTAGSGVVTLAGNASVIAGIKNAIDVGHPLAIFGHIPAGGRDNTTLTADPGTGGTSLQVASTSGFPSSGYLAIPNNAGTDYELIHYTGGIDATHFNGCQRGYAGTTAVAHNVGTAVDRCVYETFIVKSISGDDITLDEGRTIPFTSTLIDCNKGVFRFAVTGQGVIDGNMDPSTDDSINPAGIDVSYGRYSVAGPGILWRNWDHSCVVYKAAQDSVIRGRMADSTRPNLQLGSATWLFGNCKRNHVEIDVENCYLGNYVDSRTIIGQLLDGPCVDNTVIIRHARKVENPARESGGSGNVIVVENATDCSSTAIGIAEDGDGQWVTPGNGLGRCKNNVFSIRAMQGAAGMIAVSVSSTFDSSNVVHSDVTTAAIVAPTGGSGTPASIRGPVNVSLLTDAATIAVLARLGEVFEVTLGGNRTMGAPTGLYKGKRVRFVVIQDGTGGRTLAWNVVYKQAWSDSGNTANKRSTIDFYCYDGTNLQQVGAQGPYV